MIEIPTSLDGLLDQRVKLEQPTIGYRVAIDTVLLAAAVPALEGDKILDMGCGVGGAMICLACRVPNMKGLGIEIVPEIVELCHHNIGRNVFASGLVVRREDATSLPFDLHGIFDHVLMNPPYHEEKRHDASPNDLKHAANIEKKGDLILWIAAAAAALKPSGTLTMIHRADRHDEILSFLQKTFGEVEVLPLLPKTGTVPKRMLIRARKNAAFVVQNCYPLILHQDSGAYTEEADTILRLGEEIAFRPF
ncbi:MAG: methyltransferase [Bdellovibrionales bacterium]